MIADKLRNAIFHAAISGRLTSQLPEEGSGSKLLDDLREQKSALVREKIIRKPPVSVPLDDETLPFEIPTSWRWVRLVELVSYAQRGRSPKYADFSPYLVVSQKCIQWAGFDASAGRPYESSAFEKLPEFRTLRTGDILWNSTGTGTVGRVLVLTQEDIDSSPPMAADSHITVLRCLEGVCPDYLTTYLSSPYIQSNIDDLTSGTTKQKELNLKTILNIAVPLPPYPEQQRIVGVVREVIPMLQRLSDLELARQKL